MQINKQKLFLGNSPTKTCLSSYLDANQFLQCVAMIETNPMKASNFDLSFVEMPHHELLLHLVMVTRRRPDSCLKISLSASTESRFSLVFGLQDLVRCNTVHLPYPGIRGDADTRSTCHQPASTLEEENP